MEAHVRAFNAGVRTGDWEPMLAPFADDAELHFENAPAGPFIGLDAIRRGYREHAPDDQIQLLGIQDEEDRVVAAFAWAKGGTVRLVLEHDQGTLTKLTVIFDQ